MNSKIDSISIIVPAYNEEGSLKELVNDLSVVLEENYSDFEIIIVNDASTDKTKELADQLASENSHILTIHNERNLNVGGAFQKGLSQASMNFVSWIPADGEIPPSFFKEIQNFNNLDDVIVPYPINSFKVRSFSRALLSKIFRTLVNLIFNIKLKYQNGNNIFKLEMIKNVNFKNQGFLIHLEVLLFCIKKKNAKVTQVPFKLEPRNAGDSKAISFKNLIDIASGMIKLKKDY